MRKVPFILARAWLDYFGRSDLSVAGLKRHLTRDLLKEYDIRKETKISDRDYMLAYGIVEKFSILHPHLRFGALNSPNSIERRAILDRFSSDGETKL